MVRVKLCGITSIADAQLSAELGAHAIGLNFYPDSPRAISPFTAEKIVSALPPFLSTVGIFVNWAPAPVVALSQALRLSFAQLHGDESPQDVSAVARKIPVIKALRLEKGSTLPAFSKFRDVSAFLLDTAGSSEFGGTGRTTDWQLAQQAARSQRVILAGGLTPENVAEAILAVRPYAVDVASGVESRPGKKDHGKLRAFFSEANRAIRLLATPAVDPFVGSWQLDPSTLDYQFGRPGRRATYVIEIIPGGLRFHLDADDADGKLIKVTYGGVLDGREQSIPELAGAALVLHRPAANLIESLLKRDGKIVDRWTRELLPDNDAMRIVQHVDLPTGEKFRNTGIYRRIK
jgi:phosphoribosylanthranilate isomerase